jgi:hypothetical protein
MFSVSFFNLIFIKNYDIIYIESEEIHMTKEQKLALMKDRLATLQGSPKNIKCPGVVRKLARQIRSMES